MIKKTAVLAALLLWLVPLVAVATTTGTLSGSLVDASSNRPIAGVTVTASSPSGRYTTTTDPAGRFSFISLSPDTYTVTASVTGYEKVSVTGIIVQADQSLSVILAAARRRPTPVPQPTPTPLPRATPRPTPRPTRGPVHRTPGPESTAAARLVHDSVLSMFNDAHPEHASHEPYYGRYSYVLLRDGDGTIQRKNRAFVTALVIRYAAANSKLTVGPPVPRVNPWSYNVFFFPVVLGMREFKLGADKTSAVNTLLAAYAYDKATAIRDGYCAVAAHASRSICTSPYHSGPIVITVLQPLPRDIALRRFPPSFAADFTDVIPEQFGDPLDKIQREITIKAPIENDRTLPTPFAAKIASKLDQMRVAMVATIPSVKAWLDPLLGSPKPSPAATPRRRPTS